MKKILFLILLSPLTFLAQSPCVDGMVLDTWPCENVDMYAYMTLDEIGGGANTNDCWGWSHTPSGREFALVGKDNGTAFVEITDPVNPVYLGTLPTHSGPSLWRDIKVDNDYAYIVSEAGEHGLQVFDLTLLLDVSDIPAEFEESAYLGDFGHAHNIVINEDSHYAFVVGASTFAGGLHAIDLSDPMNTVTAGGFDGDGYTHDAQVVAYHGPDSDYSGKELAFCANEDNVAIVDVTDKTDMSLITHLEYTDVGYTHQLWLSEDHKYVFFNDETDELDFENNTRTYIGDITDIDNPVLLGFFEADVPSIDHNLYTEGNLIYASNYRSGLRIIDYGDVANENLVRRGFFDVTPSTDDVGFSGSWSNYCYFKNGTVIATDMYDGFFVLKPVVFEVNTEDLNVVCGTETLEVEIEFNTELSGTGFDLEVDGLPGDVNVEYDDLEIPGTNTVTLTNLSTLPQGEYFFNFVLQSSDYGQYYIESFIESENDPGPAVLVSPISGALISAEFSENATFVWEPVEGAGEYVFQISDTETFDDVIYEDETTSTEIEVLTEDIVGSGELFWRVVVFGECGGGINSDPQIFIFDDNSIFENEDIQFSVYPNPAESVLMIEGFLPERILITDLSGRLIFDELTQGRNTLQLEVSGWDPGVYFLTDNTSLKTIRFIKK